MRRIALLGPHATDRGGQGEAGAPPRSLLVSRFSGARSRAGITTRFVLALSRLALIVALAASACGGNGSSPAVPGGAGGSGGRAVAPVDARGADLASPDAAAVVDMVAPAADTAVAADTADAAAAIDAPVAALLAVGTSCPAGQSYGDPLPASPTIKTTRGGFGVLEGPVWHAAQEALFFSEFEGLTGRIHKYTPADGAFVVFADRAGVNGLALDPDGNIVAASQDMQALTRFDLTTARRTLVPGSDRFMNRPFNVINDVLVRGDGNMYFSDPTFNANGRPGQGVTAYYRLSPAAEVTRLGTGPQPNSLGISPDGRWLYVTSSGEGDAKVWRHPLNADGSVGERTDFLSVRSESLAIDCAGNLYLSAAGKISAYTAAGTLIRTFGNIPAGITNLAIGGDEARTLYITARGALYETPLLVPGLPN
jgi:gluconolactonase